MYSDCIWHIHAVPPPLDTVVHVAHVDLRLLELRLVRGKVQVCHNVTEKDGHTTNFQTKMPQKGDILVTIDAVPSEVLGIKGIRLRACQGESLVGYLRRCFGIENLTPVDERGWVFLERFITMIKLAMSNDQNRARLLVSNLEDTRKEIYEGAEVLQLAAEKTGEIDTALQHFLRVLQTKKFSDTSHSPTEGRHSTALIGDALVVSELMTKVVETCGQGQWAVQRAKQGSMGKRIKKLLWDWGTFSEKYSEEAGFMQEWSWAGNIWAGLNMLALVVAPVVYVLVWFVFPLQQDPPDIDARRGLATNIATKVPICIGVSSICVAVLISALHEFAGAPLSMALLFLFLFMTLVHFAAFMVSSMAISYLSGTFPVPMNSSLVDPVVSILVVVGPGCCCRLAWSKLGRGCRRPQARGPHRRPPRLLVTWVARNLGCKLDVDLLSETIGILMGMMFYFSLYSVLCIVFRQLGAVAQCFFVLLFFILRHTWEPLCRWLIMSRGKDALLPVQFFGLLAHSLHLMLALASAKSYLVLVIVTVLDVAENGHCLFSIAKAARARAQQQRRVATYASLNQGPVRSCHDNSQELYIASTLIQREIVEFMIPLQSIAVLTALYRLSPKHNNWVAHWIWHPGGYSQAMEYILINLVVEFLVTFATWAALQSISPRLSPWKIVRGAVLKHYPFFACMLAFVWMWSLLNQSVVGGSDFSLQFSWVGRITSKIDDVQWCGGFKWVILTETNCSAIGP